MAKFERLLVSLKAKNFCFVVLICSLFQTRWFIASSHKEMNYFFSYCCVHMCLNISNKYILLINEGKGPGTDSSHIKKLQGGRINDYFD